MKKLMLVLIFIATVVSGCKTSKVSGTPGGATVPSDPKAEVIEASRKFIALKSLTGKIEGNATTPYKQQVEYAAPDRYHVVYRDNAGAEAETIMGGNDAWVKSGDSLEENARRHQPDSNHAPSFHRGRLEIAL